MYERVVAVVPWVGKGTLADPRRPMYAPLSSTPTSRSGILAYNRIASDDHLLALCEFVAADRKPLLPILADRNVKAFLKGRDKLQDALLEFKKHKKDFDINRFMVRVP